MYYYPNQPSMQYNAGMYNSIPANPFAYEGYSEQQAQQDAVIQHHLDSLNRMVKNNELTTEILDFSSENATDYNACCNPQTNGYTSTTSNTGYAYDYNQIAAQQAAYQQQMMYQQQMIAQQQYQQMLYQQQMMQMQQQNMFQQPMQQQQNMQMQQHSPYDNGTQQQEWHPQTNEDINAFNNAKLQQIMQMQQQQNMIQQPMQQYGQIVPVGYGGYNQMQGTLGQAYQQNGGYYTGNYMNLQQQQQIQAYNEAINKEQQWQSDVMKMLFKSACAFSGKEATEEELSFYDRKPNQMNLYGDEEDLSGLTMDEQMEYRKKRSNEIALDKRMHCQYMNTVDTTAARQAYLNNINVQAFNKERERVPADTDLYTYLKEYAPFEYFEALQTQNKKTLSANKLYDREDYKNLVNQFGSKLFGNALNPNASADDQEIHLPTYISSEERQAKRKAFFDSIFSNMRQSQKGDGN